MKNLLCILLFQVFLLTQGCSSKKEIFIIDSQGNPVADCIVFAKQANISPCNQEGFFKSDENGKIAINYNGLVNVYAGQNGYAISFCSVTGDKKVKLSIFSLNELSGKKISKSGFPVYEISSSIKSVELQRWMKYSQTTAMLIIEPTE